MKRLMEKMLCKHKWEEISRHEWERGYWGTGADSFVSLILKCRRCGLIKKITH